jgi:hypothetical protein
VEDGVELSPLRSFDRGRPSIGARSLRMDGKVEYIDHPLPYSLARMLFLHGNALRERSATTYCASTAVRNCSAPTSIASVRKIGRPRLYCQFCQSGLALTYLVYCPLAIVSHFLREVVARLGVYFLFFRECHLPQVPILIALQ